MKHTLNLVSDYLLGIALVIGVMIFTISFMLFLNQSQVNKIYVVTFMVYGSIGLILYSLGIIIKWHI